jgi:CheY-like chemotaxis protein/two-component sensor histidine kinase
VGAVADITTRKSVEIARREAERRKDEFLAMLGHELRNPLAAIRSATELVQLVAAEAHTPLARAKDVLQRQVGQMTRLVDGLLEVARITRGKIELKREILDLRTVTAQAVQDRDHAVRNDAVGLRCDVPPEPLWVDADEARIVQILDNLLGNALRFTEDGVVRCDLRRDGDHAVMEVSDTGTGIDPAALPWLFEPFRQQTGGGGLGLGLALVKGLVDLHGGTVTGHSEGLGQGARFTVRLPLAERSVADGGENARLDVPPQQILIVEDNTDAGQILRELLIARGHDCEVAEEGGQALEMLRARGRSVVLCDLGLPDMTGHDVARAIRADPSQQGTRLIAISGYGQPGDRQRATEAGFDAHLTKPVELDTLEDLIGRLVRRR